MQKNGNEDLLEDLVGSILGYKVKCKEVVKEARIGQKRPDEKFSSLDIRATLDNRNRNRCRDTNGRQE